MADALPVALWLCQHGAGILLRLSGLLEARVIRRNHAKRKPCKFTIGRGRTGLPLSFEQFLQPESNLRLRWIDTVSDAKDSHSKWLDPARIFRIHVCFKQLHCLIEPLTDFNRANFALGDGNVEQIEPCGKVATHVTVAGRITGSQGKFTSFCIVLMSQQSMHAIIAGEHGQR